jgi:hypothetical protein
MTAARARSIVGALAPLILGFAVLQWLGVILTAPLVLWSLGLLLAGWPRRALLALGALAFVLLLLMAAMALPWGGVEGGVTNVSQQQH